MLQIVRAGNNNTVMKYRSEAAVLSSCLDRCGDFDSSPLHNNFNNVQLLILIAVYNYQPLYGNVRT